MSDEEKQAKVKAEAKVEAEARAKAKTQAEARAMVSAKAQARAKLEKEANMLGIKRTKIKLPPHSKLIKDMPAEITRHEMLSDQRLAKRIAKKKAKILSQQAARRILLLARLTHSHDFPKKMVLQYNWELNQMALKQWRPGQRMPKGKKSVYEDIMDEN